MSTKFNRSPTPDESEGMAWWNAMSEADRMAWALKAQSATVAEVWEFCKRTRAAGSADRVPDLASWNCAAELPRDVG